MLVRTFRKNLEEHATAVAMAGAPGDCYVRVTKAIAWCGDALARIEKRLSGGVDAYQKTWERWEGAFAPAALAVRSLDPYTSASRALYWAGAGYLCLEIVFSGLLCAYYFRLPTPVAVALGMVIAVCIALAMKGLPASLTVADNRSPAEVRRKLTGLLWMLGPPHAVLMTALALSRGGGPLGEVLNSWFDPLAAVLSVFTPILAGIAFVAATYYGWSARAEAEWVALESLRCDVEMFKTECEERLARLTFAVPEPIKSSSPAHLVDHRLDAASAVVFGVTITALSLTTPAPVQAQTPPIIAIDIDATRSVNRTAAERVVLGSVDAIASLAEATNAIEFQITTFASDGFTALPRSRILWPSVQGVKCSPFQPSEIARLIRHRYDVEQAQWRRGCEQQETDARAARLRARATAVADLRASLASAVRTVQPGCTALWDRLVAVSQRRRATFEVIFTDAEETCTRLKSVPVPRSDVRAVLVVLPSASSSRDGPTDAERFARVRSELRDAAWIPVVTPIDWPFALDAAATGKGGRYDAR